MKTVFLIVPLLGVLVAAQVPTTAPEDPRPQVVNGKLVEEPFRGTLAETVDKLAARGQAAWVGYSAPKVAGVHHMCCFNARSQFKNNPQCCGGCRLESGDGSNTMGRVADCPLPQTDRFFVLTRVASGEVQNIRPASVDCGLDLGGLTLYWLGPAKPAESTAWLMRLASGGSRKLSDHAVDALGVHAGPSAEEALTRIMGPQFPKNLRTQAAFWLGSEHGRRGFESVRDAIGRDGDPDFREEALFALSESKEPGAEPELIRLARQDPDHGVRGQALFWLAQKASRKAGAVISDVIDNDPDTDVKKKAVFALSQMERDEGVPLLIKVASTHKNPAVRKEALFWLGQSGDPRALDFIESILKR
jgi:hypothetical protein